MSADPSVKKFVSPVGPRILNRRSHGSVTSTQQYLVDMEWSPSKFFTTFLAAVSTPTQVNMCGRAKCMEHVGETLG